MRIVVLRERGRGPRLIRSFLASLLDVIWESTPRKSLRKPTKNLNLLSKNTSKGFWSSQVFVSQNAHSDLR